MRYVFLLFLALSAHAAEIPRVALHWKGEAQWYSFLKGALGEENLYLFDAPAQEPEVGWAEWGRRNQIDLVIFVLSRKSRTEYVLEYRLLETISDRVLASGSWNAREPSIRALVESFWAPLKEVVRAQLREMVGANILVRAAPGTLVFGLTDEVVSVPEDGEIPVPVRVPGVYSFRATHPDLRPRRVTFPALNNGAVIQIDQRPHRFLSLELGSLMGVFPYLAARYHFFSDRLWVGLGLQQYLWGLYLKAGDTDPSQPAPPSSFPMLIPYVTAGYFFMDADEPLRIFMMLDLGPRFYISPIVFLDPLGAFQTSLGVGVEWRVWSELSIRLSLKIDHLFSLAQETELLYAIKKSQGPVFALPLGVIQFPLLIGGLSWSF